MSDRKWPPITISIPDRDTGEERRVELNYSRMTIPDAYVWESQLQYFMSVMRSWSVLLKQVIERDSEQTGYQLKREAKFQQAVDRQTEGEKTA